MFYGVMGVVFLIILANVIGSNQTPTTPRKTSRAETPQQQQNPTPAQIRDWENNLKQQEAQLLDETARHAQQMARDRSAQGEVQPMTAEDLQRAAALQDAAQARAGFQQTYGSTAGTGSPQKSQLQTEQEQQAYKSLFADNVVRQEGMNTSAVPRAQTSPQPSEPPRSEAVTASARPKDEPRAATEPHHKALDFNPAAQPTVWLPEGTVLEAVLTNRLDGDAVGPVNCMITTDVYLPGARILLVPQGARVLGNASKVSSFGQQRLAVAFHRILVPGLHPYSIPLDKQPPGLAQAGEVGLHDKVNSHYVSIFGASLAIGAIGGLAQIGNGFSGFGYDPSVQFRNGVSQSLAESSARVLDRFLNRMPTITIREGTRVKILLIDDLQLPTYDSMHTGDM